MSVKCRVCLREKGRSASFPNRQSVVKHRRKVHPGEPKKKQYPVHRALPTKLKGQKDKHQAQPKLRYCWHCGCGRRSFWNFCPACGTKL